MEQQTFTAGGRRFKIGQTFTTTSSSGIVWVVDGRMRSTYGRGYSVTAHQQQRPGLGNVFEPAEVVLTEQEA